MLRAIHDYRARTGIRIGFKPAGGISTPQAALVYRELVRHVLGDDCVTPDLFRIGASSLLNNIVDVLGKQ